MNKKPIIFIALIALVAVVGAWMIWFQPQPLPSLTQEEFPQQMDGLPLVQLATGSEAIKQISMLHGTDIDIVSGIVAMYGGHDGAKHIIVWVSESANKAEATKLLDIMDEKMPNSKAFSNYQVKMMDGRTYYYVTGPDPQMENYYYQKGERLYWVGVQGGDADETMKNIVDKF